MSSAEAFDVIEQRLDAMWTATPVVFENEDWPTPNDPAPFVFVEVYGDSFDQASIGAGTPGGNKWREEGQLLMHVLVPSGTGSRAARVYAKQLVQLFAGEEIGSVIFRTASIGATEPGEKDGQYFRLTATVSWYRDE